MRPVTPTPEPVAPEWLKQASVRLEHDTRGGPYAIRERGRFLSNPSYDDFDDESAP